jgi:predicted porin
MKKTLVSLAVMAGMAASSAALAGDATVYGNVHISINQWDDKVVNTGGKEDNFFMSSNTSSIGVKGSEDLGDGLKALFKLEWQVAVDEGGDSSGHGLTDRDQWVGLKGGMGTVKFGTMSSNYKQMGGKVDPFYRTNVEGRGALNMQSPRLHGGQGDDRGRMNNAIQYSSPKMGGMQVVLNVGMSGDADTTANPDDDETIGIGFRYQTKNIMAYVDMIEPGFQGTNSESATKIGGKYTAKNWSIGGQMEQTEDFVTGGAGGGGDYMMIAGTFSFDKNNTVALTAGNMDEVSDSFALGYMHKMSKQTSVYAAYGDVSEDTAGSCAAASAAPASVKCKGDDSVMSFGLKKKF